jgi:hypothetical protein
MQLHVLQTVSKPSQATYACRLINLLIYASSTCRRYPHTWLLYIARTSLASLV